MSKPCAVCGCFGTCHEMCPSGDVVHEPDIRDVAEVYLKWQADSYDQPSMGDYSHLDLLIKQHGAMLAEQHGFTFEQLEAECADIYNEAATNEGPYGRNVWTK